MPQAYKWRSPRSLTELIGADYRILKDSGSPVITRFYWTAFLLLVIAGVTLISVWIAMSMLFHALHIELLFSFFFSLLFLLMYIFLLNTFSKESLKTKKRANITRAIFVVFMAFVISKPIEIKILNSFVQVQTEQYKAALLNNYKRQLDKLVEKDVVRLQNRKSYLDGQLHMRSSMSIINEITAIDERLVTIEADKADHIELANNKIAQADFFVFKIKTVSGNVSGWLIFFLVVVLFTLPGYLIYSIAVDDAYYTAKKEQERNMIVSSYTSFLTEYSKTLSRHGITNVQYYTVFADPPFNTRRKSDNQYNSQKNFFDSFLSPEI